MKFKPVLSIWMLAVVVTSFINTAYAETHMYFIRHADIDLDSGIKQLTPAGEQRSHDLVNAMNGVLLTHIFVTDYPRTLDTAEPISKSRNMEAELIPYRVKRTIGPMINALKSIPDGSSVLIVANSGNLFEIMSGMGVATNDSMPCDTNKCFDIEAFDNIWHVTISGNNVSMRASKY